jgi:hypothetical protein
VFIGLQLFFELMPLERTQFLGRYDLTPKANFKTSIISAWIKSSIFFLVTLSPPNAHTRLRYFCSPQLFGRPLE